MAYDTITTDEVKSYLAVNKLLSDMRKGSVAPSLCLGDVLPTVPTVSVARQMTGLWKNLTDKRVYAISATGDDRFKLVWEGKVLSGYDILKKPKVLASIISASDFDALNSAKPTGAAPTSVELNLSTIRPSKSFKKLLESSIKTEVSELLYDGKPIEFKLDRITLVLKGGIYVPSDSDTLLVQFDTGYHTGGYFDTPEDTAVKLISESFVPAHDMRCRGVFAYRGPLNHKFTPVASGEKWVASYSIVATAPMDAAVSVQSSTEPKVSSPPKKLSTKSGKDLMWNILYRDATLPIIPAGADKMTKLAELTVARLSKKSSIGFLLKHSYTPEQLKNFDLRGVDEALVSSFKNHPTTKHTSDVTPVTDFSIRLEHAVLNNRSIWESNCQNTFDDADVAENKPKKYGPIYRLSTKEIPIDECRNEKRGTTWFVGGPQWTELSTHTTNHSTEDPETGSHIDTTSIDVFRVGTVVIFSKLKAPKAPKASKMTKSKAASAPTTTAESNASSVKKTKLS
jgi:hypothetical protein